MSSQSSDQLGRITIVYQRREGAFSRPSVLANAKTMEPAAWWAMYGKHLPLLSSIAPKVLAQAAVGVSARRDVTARGVGVDAQVPVLLADTARATCTATAKAPPGWQYNA